MLRDERYLPVDLEDSCWTCSGLNPRLLYKIKSVKRAARQYRDFRKPVVVLRDGTPESIGASGISGDGLKESGGMATRRPREAGFRKAFKKSIESSGSRG